MINILNAGNFKVFDGIVIGALSIVKHTEEPINMICFTMDLQELDSRWKPITKEMGKYVEKILKNKNKESKFTLVDMTEIYKKELANSANANTHFTPYTLLRLLADKVEMPDRYIYLDTDTVVNRDLSLLFNYNLKKDTELGVVKDVYRINKGYFNAGVMLVQHQQMLKGDVYKKALYLVTNKKMLYADQDALNKSVNKKEMLPLIFNAKDKYFSEIVVHHFCNVRKKGNFFHRVKPWEVDLVKEKMSAYNDILDDYVSRKEEIDKLKAI